jgi:hypothetical protein
MQPIMSPPPDVGEAIHVDEWLMDVSDALDGAEPARGRLARRPGGRRD